MTNKTTVHMTPDEFKQIIEREISKFKGEPVAMVDWAYRAMPESHFEFMIEPKPSEQKTP